MSGAPSVLIRCDGHASIGMGHVVRCIALADALQAHDCAVTFAMRGAELGFEAVRKAHFPVLSPTPQQAFDYHDWLRRCIRTVGAAVLIVDVRDELDAQLLSRLASDDLLIVGIDDGSERRRAYDLMFYPPVPQLDSLDWEQCRGERHVGWEWVLLRSTFCNLPRHQSNTPPHLLLSMGGSDPQGLTRPALQALLPLTDECIIDCVIGPACSQREAVLGWFDGRDCGIRLHDSVQDMAGLMLKADLALICFGVTAYELAAAGVPALHIALDADHAQSSLAFSGAGMALSLGVHTQLDWDQVRASTHALLRDRVQRAAMAQTCRTQVSGCGARHVAQMIVERAGEMERHAVH